MKKIKKNIVDRVVEFVAPTIAMNRYKARAQMASWTGASRTRNSLRSWRTNALSPNQVNLEDREQLIERSNWLDRNNSIARGACSKTVECVIGMGLNHKSKINHIQAGITREQADELEAQCERIWKTWSNARFSTLEMDGNFHHLVRISKFDRFVDGDVLLNKRYKKATKLRKRATLGTCFQLIRGSRITNSNNEPDTDTKIAGINIDADGVIRSFDVLKYDPGDLRDYKHLDWMTVNAFDSMGDVKARLLFNKRRTGEYRGVPALSTVVELLKQITDYASGVASSAVLFSFFTAFIKTANGGGLSTENDSLADTVAGLHEDEGTFGTGNFVELNQGDDITVAQSAKNNSEFDQFFSTMMKQVGMALQINYQVLLGHFSSSYSSARAEILEAWRHFKLETRKEAENVYQFAYEAVISEAHDKGLIDLPGLYTDNMVRAAFLNCDWTGQAIPQIDPVRGVKASILAIDAGLSTGERESSEYNGSDYNENLIVLSQEQKQAQDLGIPDRRSEEISTETPMSDGDK